MTAISDLLTNLRVGNPATARSIFVTPLFLDEPISEELLTLDEALAEGAITVNETSLDGSVSELMVTNSSEQPVFLLDGEQVLGLKQNRTFNLSMLVPAKETVGVPVSCLERGRWARSAASARSAAHAHFSKGRAAKMRSVSESLRFSRSFRSDQGRVWADIEDKLENVVSPTAAEADLFEHARARVELHESAFEPQPGQCGMVVGFGNQVVGFDVFGSSNLFQRLADKLARSYLLDAPEEGAASPPQPLAIQKILADLCGSSEERFAAPGAGESYRAEGPAGHSAALFVHGDCIHAAGFCHA